MFVSETSYGKNASPEDKLRMYCFLPICVSDDREIGPVVGVRDRIARSLTMSGASRHLNASNRP